MLTAQSLAESISAQANIHVTPSQVRTDRDGYTVTELARTEAFVIGRSVFAAFAADPEAGTPSVTVAAYSPVSYSLRVDINREV